MHENGFSFGPEPDDGRRARFAALYFDLARYAGSNQLSLNDNSDFKILKGRSFLIENDAKLTQIDGATVDGTPERLDRYLIRSALESVPKGTEGRWSILYEDGEGECAESEINSIIISLYNMMPVPDNSTTIDDILKFNAGHRKELQRLRLGVSHLAERLVRSSPMPEIATFVRDEIEQTFETLSADLRKERVRFLPFSVDIGFGIPADALKALMGIFGVPDVLSGPISNSVSFAFRGPKTYANLGVDFSYCLKAAQL